MAILKTCEFTTATAKVGQLSEPNLNLKIKVFGVEVRVKMPV
jgi:hypothetical protein